MAPGVAALAVAGFALSRRAQGETGFGRSFHALVDQGDPPASFRLGLTLPPAPEIRTEDLESAAAAETEVPPDRPRKLHKFWIGAVSLGTIGGSAYNSFGDTPSRPFHFTNEGWFGQNTYAGGGDKASHFVSFNAVARMLTPIYAALGASQDGAQILGAAVSFVAGLTTEFGDGTTRYGFSYEDAVTDALGAAAALATAHYGLDDLVGFRAGIVPHPRVVDAPAGTFGKDYSAEIYTGDLKIAGLARRLHVHPGPARFLLVSATYGVKGYPYALPELRQRQIGIEIGLHVTEIMRALGVPQRPWWGQVLYYVFDTVRLPYTAIGYRYDLNHGKWLGPDIGDGFPGGP